LGRFRYATLNGCTLIANQVFYSLGGGGAGGAYGGTLDNCFLTKNFTTAASGDGGGAAAATLNNCTLCELRALMAAAPVAAPSTTAFFGIIFRRSYVERNLHLHTRPRHRSRGNMAADPQLRRPLPSVATSPCRGERQHQLHLNGTDIDGQSWEAQPSIGVTNGILNGHYHQAVGCSGPYRARP